MPSAIIWRAGATTPRRERPPAEPALTELPGLVGYEVRGRLGSGETGVVVCAWQTRLERLCAIKELSPRLAHDAQFRVRFRAEARILATFDHPRIVRVYDYVETGAAAYLVMECVEGASLAAVLQRTRRLTPEQSLGLLEGALEGLGHAHAAGVLHRDLIPPNVLVDNQGVSKLSDFGLDEGGSAAVAAYRSPEQRRGEPADERSDIYACGAIVYECLTGQPPPGPGSDPRARLPTLPAAVARMVTRAMAEDPADRPADTAALRTELATVAGEAYGADWRERAQLASLVGAVVAAGAGLTAALGGAATGSAATATIGQAGATVAGAVTGPLVPPSPPAPPPLPVRRVPGRGRPRRSPRPHRPPSRGLHLPRALHVPAIAGAVAVPIIAVVVIVAVVAANHGANPPPPTPSATATGAITAVADPAVARAASAFCTTEAQAELAAWDVNRGGVSPFLMQPATYTSAPAVLAVPVSLATLSGKLASITAQGADAITLRKLSSDVAAERPARLGFRDFLVADPGAQQASQLDLSAQPPEVARAFLTVIATYLATARDAVSARLPACAAPLLTEASGPGPDEASGATVTDRISTECSAVAVAYDFQDMGPLEHGTTTFHRGDGAVIFNGTPYTNTGGPISFRPGATDVVFVHNDSYRITGLTCIA